MAAGTHGGGIGDSAACGWTCPRLGVDDPCREPPARRLPDGEAVLDARCAFHSRDAAKDPEPVHRAVRDMHIVRRFRCSGWVFPFRLTLPDLGVQAHFPGATFEEGVTFGGRQFDGLVDFRDADFKGPADFNSSRFAAGSEFDGAVFWADADFRKASFGPTQFTRATFLKHVQFTDATFRSIVVFHRTRFTGAAYFGGEVTFEKEAVFWDAEFEGTVVFRARFLEPSTFDEVGFGPDARFGGMRLEPVTFRLCTMGGVALSEAYGIAQAEYDRIAWGTYRARRFGRWETPVRDVVREEVEARASRARSDFRKAERVYREVRRSLEDHRHFREADRFGSRELEMRRLAYSAAGTGLRGWLQGNLWSFEAIYHHIGDYGESWRRPTVCLAVAVFLFFPWLFAGAGADLGSGPYSLAPITGGATWGAYFDLAAFSLRTAALLNDPPSIRLSAGAQVAQVALRLLAPLLVVLISLAVRRRFRR